MTLLALLAGAQAMDLGYDDALRMAEDANPSIAVARAGVTSAQAGLLASRGVWDPQLTMELGQNVSKTQGRQQGIRYTSENEFLSWQAGLSQTLPTGTSWSLDWDNGRSGSLTRFLIQGAEFEDEVDAAFSTGLSASVSQNLLEGYKMSYNLETVRSAQSALTQAEISLLATRQEIVAGVATAYWELVDARAALQSAQRALAVAEEEGRIVRAQVEVGNLAPVESTRVRAAIAQAKLTLLTAEIAEATAADGLALLLRIPLDEELVPLTQPAEIPASFELEAGKAIDAALEGNPNLEIQRMTVADAEAELATSRHARLPTLALTASYGITGYEDEGGGYAVATQEMLSNDLSNRYVGASFSSPLGNRVARGQHDSAAAQLLSAQRSLEAEEASVAQQAAAAVRTLDSARRQVELAELNLQLAEETLAAEKALQEAGRAIQKDVLDSQRNRYEAEVGLIQARTAFAKARVELEALQGKL